MENLVPKRPGFNIDVSVETIYAVLSDYIDEDCYKDLLYKIYKKAHQLDTKKNELEGKIMKKNDKIHDLRKSLEEWEDGEKNFLLAQITEEDREKIMDDFFIMINEYNMQVDHVKKARNRLKKRLPLHENAAGVLAILMSNLLSVVEDRLIPDNDSIHLDTSKLSTEERKKIERLIETGRNERIKIKDQAVSLNPADLHIEGNQVLIDPKKLDPRERETLRSALDPNREADSSVALPVRALVQTGENVDENLIRTHQFSFPEEDPGEPEEADQDQYSNMDETTNGGGVNDGLPFD